MALGLRMPKIEVNNINLFYKIKGQGEPVLFLHGLGSSTIDWEHQIPYFAKNYQTITVDTRGHGQSDKPSSPYSIALFTEDIAKFIQSSAIETQRVHIVGISMGGMVALQLAVSYPELVKSIVVVNSGADFTLKNLSIKYQYLKRNIIVKLVGMRKMGEVLANKLFPDEQFAETRELFANRWATNDKKAYLNSMRAIVNWTVEDKLDKITCPTLILAADQDYSPIEQKKALAKAIENAELVIISNSRHATPIDQKDKFNNTVGEFLKGLN